MSLSFIPEKDEEKGVCNIDVEMESSHCNGLNEAGSTVIGVAVSVVCLGIIIIVIIVAGLCWWR